MKQISQYKILLIGQLHKTIARINLEVHHPSKKIGANKFKEKLRAVHYLNKIRPVILRISLKVRKDLTRALRESKLTPKTRLKILIRGSKT